MTEFEGIEIKTIGQLIDELTIVNLKVWHLVDRAKSGDASPDDAKAIQEFNQTRSELTRALDRRFGERDIGGKVYEDPA